MLKQILKIDYLFISLILIIYVLFLTFLYVKIGNTTIKVKYVYTEECLTLRDNVECGVIRYIEKNNKKVVDSWISCDYMIMVLGDSEINIPLGD